MNTWDAERKASPTLPARLNDRGSKLNVRGVALMKICITDFSLWFSLPMSIWLMIGWVSLIFHWQAMLNAACQMENIRI